MPHTFRTAYGDYNIAFDKDTIPDKFRHFMMGLYQGNSCAPQIWSNIRSIVFSVLQTQGFGIHIVNTFTAEISQLIVFSYIDDCDMIQPDDDI